MKRKKVLSIMGACILIIVFSSLQVSAAANVVEVSSTVKEGTDLLGNKLGTIRGTFQFKNVGDQPSPNFLVEIQPRSAAFAVVSQQGVCDSRTPNTVHKVISNLQPNEQVTVVLETGRMVNGNYGVNAVTFDSCCTFNPSCAPSGPYASAPVAGNKFIGTVKVVGGITASPVCGDGICIGSENAASCPSDCPAFCNDGICSLAEEHGKPGFCSADCPTPTQCGNGVCDTHLGETYNTCIADCPTPPPPPDNCVDRVPPCSPNIPGPGIAINGAVVSAVVLVVAGLGVFLVWRRR